MFLTGFPVTLKILRRPWDLALKSFTDDSLAWISDGGQKIPSRSPFRARVAHNFEVLLGVSG